MQFDPGCSEVKLLNCRERSLKGQKIKRSSPSPPKQVAEEESAQHPAHKPPSPSLPLPSPALLLEPHCRHTLASFSNSSDHRSSWCCFLFFLSLSLCPSVRTGCLPFFPVNLCWSTASINRQVKQNIEGTSSYPFISLPSTSKISLNSPKHPF